MPMHRSTRVKTMGPKVERISDTVHLSEIQSVIFQMSKDLYLHLRIVCDYTLVKCAGDNS